MLSQEAGRADANRHYGFYIDGDIAKLPGGMYYIFYSGPSEGEGGCRGSICKSGLELGI